jgi:hypothetical protein
MCEAHIAGQKLGDKSGYARGVAWAYAHPKDPDTKLREAVDAIEKVSNNAKGK